MVFPSPSVGRFLHEFAKCLQTSRQVQEKQKEIRNILLRSKDNYEQQMEKRMRESNPKELTRTNSVSLFSNIVGQQQPSMSEGSHPPCGEYDLLASGRRYRLSPEICYTLQCSYVKQIILYKVCVTCILVYLYSILLVMMSSS